MAPNSLNAAAAAAGSGGTGTPASSFAKEEPCSWFEIHHLVREVARQVREGGRKYDCILGIGNGGIIPARLLAEELGMDAIHVIPVRKKEVVTQEMPPLDRSKRYLVVDDIYDTGSTLARVEKALRGFTCDYAFCMSRYPFPAATATTGGSGGKNKPPRASSSPLLLLSGRVLNHDRWIVFPWEHEIR
jgi:hypothetical protein